MTKVELAKSLKLTTRSLYDFETGKAEPAREAALAAGTLAFELSQWIEDQFELPAADIPSIRIRDRKRRR